MMSINLAELGRVLCQEFDQREHELKTLHSEIRTRVKSDREELSKLSDVDRANQIKAQEKILEDTRRLLDKYSVEIETLAQELTDNEVLLIGEMNSWARERAGELKGWYQAGRHMSRKPEEPKGGYKSEGHKSMGYMLRKRTGR